MKRFLVFMLMLYVAAGVVTAAENDLVEKNSTSSLVTISGSEGGYEYVDLGLPSGLKWATCNVGADSPWAYGSYYAWGETKVKKYYDEAHYTCTYGTRGDTSNIYSYDAVIMNMGKPWRTPTIADYRELVYGCKWIWTENFNQSGVSGHLGISKKNGNKIFFPATGSRIGREYEHRNEIGYYWTSTAPNIASVNVSREDDDSYHYASYSFSAACSFRIDPKRLDWDFLSSRFMGLPVRAVLK